MKNRAATWIHLLFLAIIIAAVPLQVYFIASYFPGAGDSALDAHGFTGGLVIHGSEAIVFLASLVAFWGFWKWIGWSFFLLLLGTVQIFLAPPDEDPASGWVHGLPATAPAPPPPPPA